MAVKDEPVRGGPAQHPAHREVKAGEPYPYAPEEIATPPSCPPLVGGFGTETPEVAEARKAAAKRTA